MTDTAIVVKLIAGAIAALIFAAILAALPTSVLGSRFASGSSGEDMVTPPPQIVGNSLSETPLISWSRLVGWTLAGVLFYGLFVLFVLIRFVLQNPGSVFFELVRDNLQMYAVLLGFAVMTLPAVGWVLYEIYFYFYWRRPLPYIMTNKVDPAGIQLRDWQQRYKKLDNIVIGEINVRQTNVYERAAFGYSFAFVGNSRLCARKLRKHWLLLRAIWISLLDDEKRESLELIAKGKEDDFVLDGVMYAAAVAAFATFGAYELWRHGTAVFSLDFTYIGGILIDWFILRLLTFFIIYKRTEDYDDLLTFMIVQVEPSLDKMDGKDVGSNWELVDALRLIDDDDSEETKSA